MKLRVVTMWDEKKKKELQFLTNSLVDWTDLSGG